MVSVFMKKIKKVVLPVGGLGTRFLPATKSMPKEMLPVVDKPLIHYAFEEARDSGIEEFVFITGRAKNAITNHFDHNYELQSVLSEKDKNYELRQVKEWMPEPGAMIFIRQQQPKGLGHAIWCARNVIGDEPFAVILADDLIMSQTPCLKQLIELSERHDNKANIVAATRVEASQTNKYGILRPDGIDGKCVTVSELVEKPAPADAPSNIAIIGRYILQPIIFSYLQNQQTGAGGEVQITDAISRSLEVHKVLGCLYEGERFDCGDKAGFIKANIAYALRNTEISAAVIDYIRELQTKDATLKVKFANVA
jgi:UTP--glucose-1-phosphate uridylyltransferase